MPLTNSSPPVDDAALAERLRGHVEMLAGTIGPRHIGRLFALNAAAGYIEQQFASWGEEVERQVYPVDGDEAVNLVVERPGTSRSRDIIVLGAHYDTIPETPGADDNASAVAVLIEVARWLHAQPARRTVRFVAFSCEEPPHFYTGTMGSQVYARQCRRRGDNIRGMLCLEMVGYYCDGPGSQDVPLSIPRSLHRLFPREGNFLAAVGNMSSVRLSWTFRRGFKHAVRFPLFSICLPEIVSEIRLSDNSSFWDQGYPALMLTDTSFLRNPHYHQRSDTPETLDYQRMAQVTRGVAGGVGRLACVAK